MTVADQHPEYPEEASYLNTVQDRVDAMLAIDEDWDPADQLVYPDPVAAANLRAIVMRPQSYLDHLQREPYFARVDFQPRGPESRQRLYIGRASVYEPVQKQHLVYDWKAPIAQLFYQGVSQGAEYPAPKAVIRGDVLLRRRFRISYRTLLDIIDEQLDYHFDSRDSARPLRERLASRQGTVADEYLLTILQESRDGQLREIVSSIQAEQDRLIRWSDTGTLLIQGVAGSGKTSIALHRLAYLLYTYQDKLATDRVLLVCPTPWLLQSIEGVLPELGVDGIKQTTFENWALEWLNRPRGTDRRPVHVKCSDGSELLELFLNDAANRSANIEIYKRSRLKASLRLMDLIQAHTERLRSEHRAEAREIAVVYTLPEDVPNEQPFEYNRSRTTVTVSVSAERLRQAVGDTTGAVPEKKPALNDHRLRLMEWVAQILWSKFTSTTEYGGNFRAVPSQTGVRRRQHFLREVKPQIVRQVASWWPEHTPDECYFNLFGNSVALQAAANEGRDSADRSRRPVGRQPWTSEELSLLTVAPMTAKPRIRREQHQHQWSSEDLAILVAFDLLLNGPDAPPFDYMVVDEAQDLSQLQLEILRRLVKQQAMTLVGDVAQGVYSYRGLQSWEEAEAVFGPSRVTRMVVANAYRSTFEITAFANKLLAHPTLVARGAQPAVPVARHGSPPDCQRMASWRMLAEQSVQVVVQAIQDGASSAAIICKTDIVCQQLLGMLPPELADEIQYVRDVDTIKAGQPVIIPAYRAKGLEFDCVVVAGADAHTFLAREYDLKLFYVALTRALHALHIYWVGDQTPLLPQTPVTAREVVSALPRSRSM